MHTSALGAAQDSLETAPVAFSDGAIVCSAAAVDEVVVPVPSEILQEGESGIGTQKQKAAKDLPRAGRLNVLDLLITFRGCREPRLNANRAICAVPLPPFMRIYSEFAFEHTIAHQSCAALILPSATANPFPFFRT
jgi:hypothetical protein